MKFINYRKLFIKNAYFFKLLCYSNQSYFLIYNNYLLIQESWPYIMKKFKFLVLAILSGVTFLFSTSAWATPNFEQIGTNEQGNNGIIYLITDSVLPVDGMPDLFEAVVITELMNTLTNDRGITINCSERTLRIDWVQPSRPPISSISMRRQLSGKMEMPAKNSAYELLVNRVCGQK